MMLLIGMIFLSNEAFACSKPKNSKDNTHLTASKAKNNQNDNCCKSSKSDSSHNCNRNCHHHNCVCNIIPTCFFSHQPEFALESFIPPSTQRKYSIYKPFLYFDIYISIWHPPKIAKAIFLFSQVV